MKLTHLILLFMFFYSCTREKTKVTSKKLSTARERVSTLEKYVSLKSPVEDCHFEIFNVNLNAERSIPGPSSYKYELALKVTPEHFEAWTKDLTHTSFPLNTSWYDSLIAKKDKFYYSTPTFMSKDGDKIVIGYEKEGLLFIRMYQH